MEIFTHNRPGKILVTFFISILISGHLWGQRSYPPDIACDQTAVFKTIDTLDLKLWVFQPEKHRPEEKIPAIVFFFGGGWNAGSPEQFVKHCEYLSARGMVAMVADYRVASRNNVKANACVSDAKSAIRWIRENAGMLGIDPERIAAGGGSAGGHLAAATATLSEFDEPGENPGISSKPDALVLFNPALVLAPTGEENDEELKRFERLENRLGSEGKDISPYHNIKPGMPPAIIFHGTNDQTVPLKSVKIFTDKMTEAGNRCILVTYDHEGHGFFNYGRKDNGAFVSTVSVMDDFLAGLGWIQAVPEPIHY